jgi:hypothetical protein
MPYRLLTLLKCVMVSGSLAMSITLAQADTTTPPAMVTDKIANAKLAGDGQMRFLGFRIYDAQLWVGPQFNAAHFDAHPLALTLTYYRALKGAAIAKRSIEEIQQQVPLSTAQSQEWENQLAALLPDVQDGDSLTGVYQPNQGMHLFRGEQLLGTIDDPQLAKNFFGIWLSPRTSEPSLRSALLARISPESP